MYTVLRIYDDCTSITEKSENFISTLNACAIYLEDPSCEGIKVWENKTGKVIVDYWKD